MRITGTLLLLAGIWAGMVSQARAQPEKLSPDDYDYVYKTWPNVQETNTGVRYIIEQPGKGRPPGPGDLVSVLYVGRLLHGKLFDENLDPKHPFQFRIRRYQVIEGWDEILQQMRPGEKRFVIIPSELAYGTRGRGSSIPPDATLTFMITLLRVDQREVPPS